MNASSRLPRLAPLALGVLCLAGCGGPADTDDGRPNIILVSIDSLRPANLSCYGYERPTSPFIDRLAEEGVRFESAVSTTSWTLPAHAALFTGLYDSTHGLVDNGLALSGEHWTLAELLQREGYETAGFYGGPYLHPVFGMGQGFDAYQSCMTTTPDSATGAQVRQGARSHRDVSHMDVTGPRTRDEVRRWARDRDSQEPYFLFLHLWDVHYDFKPPPPYDRMFDPDYQGDISGRLMADGRIKADMDPRDLQHLLALYDGEIRFTDQILGEIFEELGGRGMLENTLVVITSDHGEEFFEHGNKGHNKTLFDEVLKIPLIAHWPGELEGGHVIPDQVRLIDLMPTLLHFAGHRGPLAVQGRNLAPLLRGRPMDAQPALAELMIDRRSLRALRTNERKALRPSDDQAAFLLRLDADPRELRAIAPGESPLEAERARWDTELLRAHSTALKLRTLLGGRDPEAIVPSQDVLERLAGMGYLDGEGDEDPEDPGGE